MSPQWSSNIYLEKLHTQELFSALHNTGTNAESTVEGKRSCRFPLQLGDWPIKLDKTRKLCSVEDHPGKEGFCFISVLKASVHQMCQYHFTAWKRRPGDSQDSSLQALIPLCQFLIKGSYKNKVGHVVSMKQRPWRSITETICAYSLGKFAFSSNFCITRHHSRSPFNFSWDNEPTVPKAHLCLRIFANPRQCLDW